MKVLLSKYIIFIRSSSLIVTNIKGLTQFKNYSLNLMFNCFVANYKIEFYNFTV